MAHTFRVVTGGDQAGSKAMIFVHGRGGSADDILHGLAPHIALIEFQTFAPQATNNTWYPYSFLVPPAQNEPWLSSALSVLNELEAKITAQGITQDNIYWLGFSQGACLTLEYAARHAQRYGGIFALSGGLIGDRIQPTNYNGSFAGTPIFLGCSDRDPHIPLSRVQES